MNPVEILLKEYETLRQEILATMNNRVSILSFGLAGIGVVFTASLATDSTNAHPLFSSLVLVLAVPAISNFVLFMWLGEYQRMQRAGKFLVELENRINTETSKELLTWETKLRTQHSHMGYPYIVTVLLLILISAVSFIIGAVNLPLLVNAIWILIIINIVIHLVIFLHTLANIAKWQE
jgi:heme/copper-type cytochrome/quinol oxidase subunit 4